MFAYTGAKASSTGCSTKTRQPATPTGADVVRTFTWSRFSAVTEARHSPPPLPPPWLTGSRPDTSVLRSTWALLGCATRWFSLSTTKARPFWPKRMSRISSPTNLRFTSVSVTHPSGPASRTPSVM